MLIKRKIVIINKKMNVAIIAMRQKKSMLNLWVVNWENIKTRLAKRINTLRENLY